MAKKKLTKRAIHSLAVPEGKDRQRYYDDELTGFGITVYASGKRVFFVQYGPKQRRRRMTLGQFGPLGLDAARKMATQILARVIEGEDPVEEKRRSRLTPTFALWADDYLEQVRPRKKSIRNDERYLKRAKARWGNRALDSITAVDVRKAFESMGATGKKVDANRWLASVRACLQAAWRDDRIPSNPAMKVKPYPETNFRERTLTNEEYLRLIDAVAALTDPYVQIAFVLLMETGARLSEVLQARWEQFDLQEGTWRIPSTKSGTPQTCHLTPTLCSTLTNLPQAGPYVVPGRKPDSPRHDLKRPWEKLKTAAELQEVWIHDIRRTVGTHIARRTSLHVASKVLRHSDIRVTLKHYAHLDREDVVGALEQREADVIGLQEERERRKQGGET